jgi:hypothetical protein
MPLGLRLLGIAFLPLVAGFGALVLSMPGVFGPGLTQGAVLGSLVLVGMLSYRWTGRATVAVAMVIASICVTSFAATLLFVWALASAFE